MDRIGVRQVMIAGASMVALSFVALSRANSAVEFLLIFIVLGIGITASTIIPSALVITNWFRESRGLALGAAFAGIPLGGTGITMLANYVILHYGFRAGYFAMVVPIALVVVPLLAMLVQTRPDTASEAKQASASETLLPGLEVREAVRSRSFWMIAVAEVLFATAGTGIRVHLVPYLTGIGYSATLAAGLFALMFIFSAIGSFAFGSFADRMGGRVTLTIVFAAGVCGELLILGEISNSPHTGRSTRFQQRDCEGRSSNLVMAGDAVWPCTWQQSTVRPQSPASVVRRVSAEHPTMGSRDSCAE